MQLLLCGAVVVAMLATLCAPQATVPPDPRNCKLNASSPFSWVVMIADKLKKYKTRDSPGATTQGAMLTYKSVITTATYFKVRRNPNHPDRDRYVIVGHHIWDWRNNGINARTNPCSQQKPIKEIIFHPKGEESNVRRVLFDYAIIIMNGYFNVSTPTFPTMFFPSSPYDFVLNVQYVNVKNEEECAIPIPDNISIAESKRDKLVINSRIDFATIKFHTKCIDLICEINGRVSDNCHRVLMNRPNATMLCAYPSKNWTKELIWGRNEVDNPYAGTPYVCNGSTLGLVTQQKKRHSPTFKTDNFDFFLILTFLRVWSWLIAQLIQNSPKFTPFYIETASLRMEKIDEPYKETPQGHRPKLGPFRYPNLGKSAAPKTTRTVSPILNAFFVTIWTSL